MGNKELTSADIFAMFDRTNQLIDKLRDETDRKFAEIKQLFNNQNVEAYIDNDCLDKRVFDFLGQNIEFAGIEFSEISGRAAFRFANQIPRSVRLEDEFDIVMENSNSIAIIKISHEVDNNYVERLTTRIVKNFRDLFPKYEKYDIYLGLGSLSFNEYVVDEARKYGIALLKQVGKTIEYKSDWAVKAY
jgi:hypothetical protein